MATRGVQTARSRVLWAAALAVTALGSAINLRAQLPMPQATLFEMTGFIQSATLETGTDPFRGGTITLNNHTVIVPRNTIFQMPATSLTWAELFSLAPAPYGPGTGPKGEDQTGLALGDTPKPALTFEVVVQGNRVGDDYIAGLLFLSQSSLQAHQGFINAIDYASGELRVGGAKGDATSGTRVRINDPIGRFGRIGTHDRRFTIDEDNPTIKSETGYPMCLPRTDPTQVGSVPGGGDDPLCPQGNRPMNGSAYQAIFTMPSRPEPSAAERANPASRTTPDPWRAAPFEVGDYVTVKGPIVTDQNGDYIDATAIDANVGIFTASGTNPAYVSIDVLLMGTGPLADATLAQEGAKRTRVEGFTTDISTSIVISAVDVDACTGAAADRQPVWSTQAVDPGPPNGAVAGRWRFRPGAPLFDLKGFPFLPPTREVHATSLRGTVLTLNGLSAGEYTAPNFEFILPENRGIGSPVVPANFEAMPFLAQGSGPRYAFGTTTRLGFVSQLSPWPGAADTKPARAACPPIADAGVTQTVGSATKVTLDGTASADANSPASPLTFAWTQTAGTSVPLTGADTATPTFVAPTLTTGAPSVTLTFQLTVSNGATTSTGSVSVVVLSPADITPPQVGMVSVSGSTAPMHGLPMTVQVTASDPTPGSGMNSVTFYYSYTQTASGVLKTFNGTVLGTLKSGTTTWTGTINSPLATTYSFYAVAADNAAPANTKTGPTSSIKVN